VAVPAKIRPVRRRGRPGEVGKMIRNSPATDLWAWLGEKGRPAGWTAAPGGGRRWSFLLRRGRGHAGD
jgi:hypothetical protein